MQINNNVTYICQILCSKLSSNTVSNLINHMTQDKPVFFKDWSIKMAEKVYLSHMVSFTRHKQKGDIDILFYFFISDDETLKVTHYTTCIVLAEQIIHSCNIFHCYASCSNERTNYSCCDIVCHNICMSRQTCWGSGCSQCGS